MGSLDFYKGKRVFVTGHTGFKGAWLCRVLLKAGATVSGYALAPETEPNLFEKSGLDGQIHSVIADITDADRLVEALAETGPDVVFHLAAQALVRRSYREPALTYATNVMGTVNVLEAVRQTPTVKSFVNVTTDKVYENREWYWGYRENERLNGFDPYSNSKSCSELVTGSYRRAFFGNPESPAVSTARSGNVIGGGDYSEDRIIPDCIHAAAKDREIIVRNPESIRPYQHVLECLSGYLLLAERQYADKTIAGAYNFGPDEASCVTTGELAGLFCAAWSEGVTWRAQEDDGPHEANFLKLDCSKAKAVLGWRPCWTIKTAVEKTVEFAKLQCDEERSVCMERQIEEYFYE